MGQVIYLWEWKRRARLGREGPSITPRTPRSRREDNGFVRIGDAAADVVRRLE